MYSFKTKKDKKGLAVKINYYYNEKTNTVYAVGTSEKPYPTVIDEAVAESMIENDLISRKDIEIQQHIRRSAHPVDTDTFDYQTGKDIARDKILSKHYEEVSTAVANYAEALRKEAEAAENKSKYCKDKAKRAQKRLDSHM